MKKLFFSLVIIFTITIFSSFSEPVEVEIKTGGTSIGKGKKSPIKPEYILLDNRKIILPELFTVQRSWIVKFVDNVGNQYLFSLDMNIVDISSLPNGFYQLRIESLDEIWIGELLLD